jgi:hypothetical protein
VLVADVCNPRYSGARDHQDDHSLKPAQANSLRDPILKKTYYKKKGWWSRSSSKSTQALRPEFKPQCYQKKKKE